MTDSQKLDAILKQMENMKSEIREVEKSLGSEIREVEKSLESKIREVRIENKETGESLEREIEDLKEKFEVVETEIKDIKLTLENEIRVNIKRIAEGHFDVSRHIHSVMNAKEEFEMLSVETRMLETEVRELKRRIS